MTSSSSVMILISFLFLVFSSTTYTQSTGEQYEFTPMIDLWPNGQPQNPPLFQSDLQTAINNAQKGTIVQLSPGVLRLSSSISISTSGITLQGSDPSYPTKIVFTSSDWITLSSSVTDVKLEQLIIEGISSPMDVSNVGVTIVGCTFTTSTGSQIIKKEDSAVVTSPIALSISSSVFVNTATSSPVFTSANSAALSQQGGLLKLSLSKSNVDITSSQFKGGKANDGGCIHISTTGDRLSRVGIDQTHFNNCVAQQDGGAIYVHIANTNADSYVRLSQGTLSFNKALRNGGGIYLANVPAIARGTHPMTAGGIGRSWATRQPAIDWRITSFSLADISFDDNMALNGGGLYMSSTSVSRLQTNYDKFIKFNRNKAAANGGGLYRASTGYVLSHLGCDFTFIENTAGEESALKALQSLTAVTTLSQQTNDGEGGAIYIGKSLNLGTYLKFKDNPTSPNLLRNKAKRGGAISSDAKQYIWNIFSTDNVAENDGGSMFSYRHTTMYSSKFFGDTATNGNGGALASGSIEPGLQFLKLQDVIIKDASAGGHGGGIYAGQANSLIGLEPAYIINCRSTGNGPAIYSYPRKASSRVVLTNALIYGNTHPTSSAIVIRPSSISTLSIWSTNTEYRFNNGGHIQFDTAPPATNQYGMTWDNQPINYKSIGDFFDDSSIKNNKPSIKFTAKTTKYFSQTYFEGVCNKDTAEYAKQAIVQQCAEYSAPTVFAAGWWGATGCDMRGGDCDIRHKGDECDQTLGKCLHAPVKKVWSDEISALLRDVTTTTTSTSKGSSSPSQIGGF